MVSPESPFSTDPQAEFKPDPNPLASSEDCPFQQALGKACCRDCMLPLLPEDYWRELAEERPLVNPNSVVELTKIAFDLAEKYGAQDGLEAVNEGLPIANGEGILTPFGRLAAACLGQNCERHPDMIIGQRTARELGADPDDSVPDDFFA